MMRLIYIVSILFASATMQGQDKDHSVFDFPFKIEEIKNHIEFLASDDLKGRATGSREIDLAAGYIKDFFEKEGLFAPGNSGNYFQDFILVNTHYSEKGFMEFHRQGYKIRKDFVILNGDEINDEVTFVEANYGMEEDYKGKNVRGCYVVVKAGDSLQNDIMYAYQLQKNKQELAARYGAAGILEIFSLPPAIWSSITGYFSDYKTGFREGGPGQVLGHFWLNETKGYMEELFRTSQKVSGVIRLPVSTETEIPCRNVIGMVRGKDPVLRNEYIIVTAHYDHIGIGVPVAGDSIYNGARDNAIGTTALMMASRYLQRSGSKRSVIFLACTAEEIGLWGSKWYVHQPVIPLDQTVFNINNDGAGYNDTSLVTLIDLKRTTADSIFVRSARDVGLSLSGDPAPEQMLYDRSDNVNFSIAGIPSVTISPGIRTFDDEIYKYYHNLEDEPETIDFQYVEKFIQVFCLSVKRLADSKESPFWMPGDKYENVGKQLYGTSR